MTFFNHNTFRAGRTTAIESDVIYNLEITIANIFEMAQDVRTAHMHRFRPIGYVSSLNIGSIQVGPLKLILHCLHCTVGYTELD